MDVKLGLNVKLELRKLENRKRRVTFRRDSTGNLARAVSKQNIYGDLRQDLRRF